jgi:PPOX class probable F420-dependent enzyme
MGVNQRNIVRMSEDEIDAYLAIHRPATMATIGPEGLIHQVAMYFAWFDGALSMLSKAKAQKVVNLRRDPRCSLHVESGSRYDELAGVNVAGRAEILEDDASLWEIGLQLNMRQQGPWEESRREMVASVLRNRVGIRLRPERTVSWDHSKLPTGEYPASAR